MADLRLAAAEALESSRLRFSYQGAAESSLKMALLALEYPDPFAAAVIVLWHAASSLIHRGGVLRVERFLPGRSPSPRFRRLRLRLPLPIVIIRVINTINSFHRRHRDRALRSPAHSLVVTRGRGARRRGSPSGTLGVDVRPRLSSAHVGARARPPPASLERKIMLAVSRPAVAPSARASPRASRVDERRRDRRRYPRESARRRSCARERLGRARRGRAAFDRRRVEIGGRRERVVVGGDDV